jgi:hypothetical protein
VVEGRIILETSFVGHAVGQVIFDYSFKFGVGFTGALVPFEHVIIPALVGR